MIDLKVIHAVLEQLEQEKGIPRATMIEAVEAALATAYKKEFGKKGQIIRAKFDLESGKTELTQEELSELEAEKQKLQRELETRKTEFQAKAKQIVESMAGKTRSEIKRKLVEAKIPDAIIHEMLPAEDVGQVKAGGTAGAGKPAAGQKK